MESGEPKVVNKINTDGGGYGHGMPFCFPYPHAHGGYGNGDGCGLGGGMSWIALLALLGGRGIGWHGDGHGHGHFENGKGEILTAVEINRVLDQLGLIEKDLGDAKQLIASTGYAVSKDITAAKDALGASIDRLKDSSYAEFDRLKGGQCEIKTEVLKGNYALLAAIKDDGEKTRALIGADILDRKNDEIRRLERENDRRHSEHNANVNRIEVTQTVNQAQAQAQLQAQKQENDRLFFANLLHGFADQFAVARATNVTKQFGTGNVAVPSNANSAVNQ